MNNKDFKRIAIGYNEAQKKQFESDLNTLTSYLNDFFSEIAKYIEVKDKNVFNGNFLNTFLELFGQKYKCQFPEFMSLEKVLELCEVNTDKIKALASKINEYQIEIDLNTNEAKTPDFTVYTESIEQNLLYKYASEIEKAIFDNKPTEITFFQSDLQRGFSGLLTYDFSTQRLKPNIGYIKGQYRRL